MKLYRRLLPALCFTLFHLYVSASGITGMVTTKATAQPLANVTVHVLNTGLTVHTNDKGFYQIDNIPAGNITLVFSADTYQYQTVSLHLTDHKTEQVNIALAVLTHNLNEIVIAAGVNPRTDRQARYTEKMLTPTVDIASGDLIEHTGSISAADVVQHIPGLSVTRTSTGNNDKAIIRGMEAKYSYTLIDGYKIPSPDDKSRYVSLDIFPAGLLQSIQVYKSLTANMEGDAIGGVVNLVMREPPDQPLLQAGVNTGYNNFYFEHAYRKFNSGVVQDKSPYEQFGPTHQATGSDFTKDNLSFHNTTPLPDVTANVLYGNKILNHQLGFIIAADYKNIKSGSDGYFIPLNAQPNLNNVPAFADFYKHSYYNNKIAVSINEQFTYKPSDNYRFTLSHFYINQKDIETRSTVDTSLILGRSSAGTGRIYISDRSREHEQQINNVAAKASYDTGPFGIAGAGVFSVSDGKYPDWAELTNNTGRLVQPDGSIAQSPSLLASLNRIWLSNKETNLDVYLDAHYKPALFNQKLTLSGGGLIRDKKRDNFYNNYLFSPTITQPFVDIYHAVWANNNGPQNPLGNVNNPNTYTAKERINAYYLMVALVAGRSEFTGGMRLEQTDQNFVSAIDPAVSYGKTIKITYNDWLPDLHWKYNFDEQHQLKASYFKGISRPALYDITFSSITYEDFREVGNPYLKRTQADNFDLNYALYKKSGSQFKVGVFYKHIIDAYEKTLLNGNDELYPIAQNGLSYTPAGELTQQLKNTGTAVNYGAEVFYSCNWRNFTLNFNYTYTSSNITRQKKIIVREDPANTSSDLIPVTKAEKGSLQGQAKHLANANLLYKSTSGNWLTNIGFSYTGKYDDLVSPWYGLDYWQRQNLTLNFSAERKLSNHFKVMASALNLLSNGIIDDILVPNPSQGGNALPGQLQNSKITVLKQNFSPRYVLGLKYNL